MKTNGKNGSRNGSKQDLSETGAGDKKPSRGRRRLHPDVLTVAAGDRPPVIQVPEDAGQGEQTDETHSGVTSHESNGRSRSGSRGRNVKGTCTGGATTKRNRYKDPAKILRDISGRSYPNDSEARTYGELVGLELFDLALQNDSLTAKMTAIREIHDRLSGKAKPLAEVLIPKTEIQMYEEAVAATIQDGIEVGRVISREEAVRMVSAGDTYIHDALSASESESGKRE